MFLILIIECTETRICSLSRNIQVKMSPMFNTRHELHIANHKATVYFFSAIAKTLAKCIFSLNDQICNKQHSLLLGVFS